MKPIIAMFLAASVAGCLTESEYFGHLRSQEGMAARYDGTWYRKEFWSGETPDGFTMAKDVTITIRATLDPDAPKSVACALRKGATYHPWNKERVAADQLEFVSLTRIKTYQVKENFTADLERRPDGGQTAIEFHKGDRWAFLGGVSKGSILVKLDDTVYVAGAHIFAEKSAEVGSPAGGQRTSDEWKDWLAWNHEWLKLTCANGANGWILYNEVRKISGFSKSHTGEYGHASDL
jgi:hypothetical protein